MLHLQYIFCYRPLLAVTALLLLHFACTAQRDRLNNRDSNSIVSAASRYYSLPHNDRCTDSVKLPFSKISFTDVRYDTSFVALNWEKKDVPLSVLAASSGFNFTSVAMDKKYNLYGGLANNLTQYFNQYFTGNFSTNSAELVCYIKRFSLTLKDTSFKHLDLNEFVDYWRKELMTHCEIECYFKKDSSLFPALRVDSDYIYHFSSIRKEFPDVVKELISPLIQKIMHVDTSKVLKRNAYTAEQISKRYNSRFNLKILTDAVYKKGIYKTFEEFKNNAPSITNYTLKKKGVSFFLYDANNELINTMDIFGFYDGAGFWIQRELSCYPLIRIGNSFEVVYRFQTNYASASYTQYTKILLPLNMETGHID